MYRVTVILLIIGIILTGVLIDDVNAKTTKKWTPEVSKKLLKSDLDSLLKRPQQEFAVTYSLQFRELDSKLINALKSKIKVKGSDKDPGVWQFFTNKATVKTIKDQAVNFSLEVEGEKEKEETQKIYNSYLTTVGNNQIKVKLEEKLIGQDVDEADITQAYIEIAAKPHQIEPEKEQVLTKLELKYKGRSYESNSGGVAEVKTTNWISRTAKNPVAIVTYQNESSDRKHRKYFGLYVTAKVMPSESLSDDPEFISGGNIHGLDKLFNRKPELFEKKNKVSLHLGGAGAELEFDKSFKSGSKLHANVGSASDTENKDFNYKLGGELSVGKDFGVALAGQMGNKITTREDPILRIGISDQVTWNNNIDFKLSYLPVAYKWPEKEKSSPYMGAMLKYRQPKWNIKYKGSYFNENRTEELSVSYDVSQKWGVEAKLEQKDWKQKQEKEKEASVGVVFKW